METTQPRTESHPQLDHVSSSDELAEWLRQGREQLDRQVLQGIGGLEAARAYSDLIDAVIQRMMGIACADTGLNVAQLPMAVVATGGYGRREVCPHSDVDITFVPHRDGVAALDRVIKEMFTLLMRVFIDANRMSVGYAYRLIEDCATLDHQTTSGLLDARLIAGSSRVFIQLESDYWTLFNPADFVFTKLTERKAQREKAGGTPRVVEPNLKEGSGGLRDLHTTLWLVQAVHALVAARVRGDRAWDALEKYAGLSGAEVAAVREAKEFLFRTRNALHVLTGAERDQLVVTRQEEVAEALGYGSSSRSNGASHQPPVERFMRDYFRHASALDRICGLATARLENGPLVLGIGLDSIERRVVRANPALAAEDPLWMLWACELAQKYNLTLSDPLEREIVELLVGRPQPSDWRQAGEVFARMLAAPSGVYPILQKMADLGILGWLIPEFGAIMDLIPYDSSHDYTVGQHSLYAVRNLDGLREPDAGEEMLDLRRALQEVPNPEQLYLAALLHDAGKADPGRPHSEVGAEMAEAVCARLGWSADATAAVRFLVRYHLLMAETSRLRDLNLDETIRDFTAVVDDSDRLAMLYLLTYADTRAVGAGVWTQVKGKFLRDLYHRGSHAIAGADSEGADDAGLTLTRRRLLRELSPSNLPPEEVAEHVESMPAPYILNTSLEDMALHIGYVRRARKGETVVEFYDERDGTYTEVTVCTPDDPRPGLLAKIAGVLYALDLEVHSAQVVTRVTGGADNGASPDAERIAIDTLYVDYRGRQLTPGKRKEVRTNMTTVLSGGTPVSEVLAKKRKPAEIGGPVQSINIRNDLSDSYTVVEIAAEDPRAMLYRASGALSALGWDIRSAKVSLFRGRSMASFYVSGARHLPEAEARNALLRLMPLVAGT